MEVIVGHCSFFALVPREALATSHDVYSLTRKSYVQSCGPQCAANSRFVVDSGTTLFIKIGVLRHLVRRTPATRREEAWSSATSTWDNNGVRQTCRVREKSFFRRVIAVSARSHALGLALCAGPLCLAVTCSVSVCYSRSGENFDCSGQVGLGCNSSVGTCIWTRERCQGVRQADQSNPQEHEGTNSEFGSIVSSAKLCFSYSRFQIWK